MKKRLTYALLAICMMFSMSVTVMAANGTISGSGTEDSPYLIEDLADLEAFRDAVNAGESYEGKTVALADNITMSGEWTSIGNGGRSGSAHTGNAFKGVFDGKDYTITGLTITTGDSSAAIGLFGVVDGGTVKNLTLTDVSINAADNKNAGAAIGLMVNGATADHIAVSGSVTAADGVGGVAGRMTISGTISDCINNATVTGTASGAGAGGIVGKAYYTGEGKVMTISGCTNNGAVTSGYAAGGIAGLSAADVKNCTNTAAITAATEAGGIVGEQVNRGTVSGNTNTAAVSNNTTGGTAYGGIIGWIRYQTNTSDYPAAANEVITVSDNTNSGSISATGASLGSGGIVGTVYNQATVTGNTNSAGMITGGTFGAGIVGGAQHSADNVVIVDATITATNNVSSTPINMISANCVASDAYNNDANSFVTEDNADAWAVQNGEKKYATLQKAVDEAASGDTLTVLTSFALTSTVTVAADDVLTIDLNGCTVSYSSDVDDADMLVNKGNLTITDNSTNKDGLMVFIYTGANNYRSTSTIVNLPGATLTVAGGTVQNDTDISNGSYAYGIDSQTNGNLGNVLLNVTGGTVKANYMAIRQCVNGYVCTNTLNVTGGNIIGGKRAINVQDLKYDGSATASKLNDMAVLNISSGTISSPDGYALCVYGMTNNLSVTDGTFEGWIFDYGVYRDVVDEGFITGGTFTDGDIAMYLAEGFVLDSYVDNGGNTVYGVEPSVTVSFDAGEGTGTMVAVTVPAGDYVLPVCGFTAPEGKQFKAWSVGGVERLSGATVSITADTVLVALWEDEGHICSPTGWKNDAEHHWKDCWEIGCFETYPGSYGAHADADKDGRCDTCNYGMSAVKPGSPATGESNSAIIWLIVALGAAACAGIMVTNKRSRA